MSKVLADAVVHFRVRLEVVPEAYAASGPIVDVLAEQALILLAQRYTEYGEDMLLAISEGVIEVDIEVDERRHHG